MDGWIAYPKGAVGNMLILCLNHEWVLLSKHAYTIIMVVYLPRAHTAFSK